MNSIMAEGFLSNVNEKNAVLKQRILSLCIADGDYSISDFSKELDSSIPTITKLVSEMIEAGYLKDLGKAGISSGRRPSIYGLNPDAGYIVGMDVRRYHISIAVTDFKGKIVDSQSDIPFALTNTVESFHDLCNFILKHITKLGIKKEQVLSYGLNLTGRVNHVTGYSYSYFIGEDKPIAATMESFLDASMLTGTLASKLKKHVRMSEQAAYREKTLQLRANLLRTISHDLRTPLTSISGNANNLMYNYDKLDNDTREQIFTDIYDDSEWLISLVENILFVTRFEDGTVTLNMSDQLIDEVIAEALKHINRKSCEHKIHVDCGKELILVKMDARLIIQVIINIVDNAIKYTQEGSDIYIKARKEGRYVIISIEDNGAGIPDDMKENVFDTFFTCNNEIADNRRSLGLGLSLCKTIINAHGSELELRDNTPHGCIFEFKLQLSEVHLNE